MPYTQTNNPLSRHSSPLLSAGKGCAKSKGGDGCVVKRGGKIVILNNKKGGIWRDNDGKGFASTDAANKVLAAYHANS